MGERVGRQVLGEMERSTSDDRIRAQEPRSGCRRRRCAKPDKRAKLRARRRAATTIVCGAPDQRGNRHRRQELQIADAASPPLGKILSGHADREGGLVAQLGNLRLIAPVDGVVVLRDADPRHHGRGARRWWR